MEACCESCASHEQLNGHGLSALKSIEAMLARLVPPSECYRVSFDNGSNAGAMNILPVQQSRLWIVSYTIVAAGATTVQWGGGTALQFRTFQGHGGPAAGTMAFASNGGVVANAAAWPTVLFATDPGEALTIKIGSGVQVGGHVSFYCGDFSL